MIQSFGHRGAKGYVSENTLASFQKALDLNADGRKINGVNIENGGLIYQNESGIIDLDVKEAIILLKLNFIPYQDLELYEVESIQRIKEFIIKYYQFHLQTTLKNLK